MAGKLSKSKPVRRNTKQREVILDIIDSAHVPMSAVEIECHARRKLYNLNKTTVYRTLERLQSENLLQALTLLPGILHYERAGRGHHHHHFVCDDCAKVYCLEGCPEGMEKLLPKRFTLREHEIVLRGCCSGCS